MIIVPVKDGENIERALKKFKRKFEKTGVMKELRKRQQYNKPSVLKRLKMEHAIYVQKLRAAEDWKKHLWKFGSLNFILYIRCRNILWFEQRIDDDKGIFELSAVRT